MSDEDLRKLERRYQGGDPDAVEPFDAACRRANVESPPRRQARQQLVAALQHLADACPACGKHAPVQQRYQLFALSPEFLYVRDCCDAGSVVWWPTGEPVIAGASARTWAAQHP